LLQQHLVLVIKGQQNELPGKNWEILQKLDPGSPEFTDEEWAKFYNPEGKGILVRTVSIHYDCSFISMLTGWVP
jgi:hypothetical protein